MYFLSAKTIEAGLHDTTLNFCYRDGDTYAKPNAKQTF